MDGSLLAPLMNSSSESFPAGKGTRLSRHPAPETPPAQEEHPGVPGTLSPSGHWGHASGHEPFNQRACGSF